MSNARSPGIEPVSFSRPFRTIGPAGRIGLIALATDNTSETDLRAMLPADAALFTTRVSYANPVTSDSLGSMREDLPRAASMLVPGTRLDAVIYGCTSGTAVIGEDEVTRLVRAGRGEVAVTTPLAAVRAALAALGVRRISLLTPYAPEVTHSVLDWLAGEEVEVVRAGCLGIDDDVRMAALDPQDIVEAGMALAADEAEAIFVSCTALPSSLFAAALEETSGRPVIASNQALAWHAMRLAGVAGRLAGPGRLMVCPLPAEAAA